MTAAMGLWADQLISGPIAAISSRTGLYNALFIFTVVVRPQVFPSRHTGTQHCHRPSLRGASWSERRFTHLICVIDDEYRVPSQCVGKTRSSWLPFSRSALFILQLGPLCSTLTVCEGDFVIHLTEADVYSLVYRWTWLQWPFFASMSVASFVVLTCAGVFAIGCLLNFNKGLAHYRTCSSLLDSTTADIHTCIQSMSKACSLNPTSNLSSSPAATLRTAGILHQGRFGEN